MRTLCLRSPTYIDIWNRLSQGKRIEPERWSSNLCTKLWKIILKMATDGTKGNAKSITNEQIINNFQALRKEQLRIGNKVSELELELHEHK